MGRKCDRLSLLFMKDSNDRAEVPVFPHCQSTMRKYDYDDYDTRKVLISQKRNNTFFVL